MLQLERLTTKDSVQEWVTKVNNILDLQTVDGLFSNSDTSWDDTTFTLSGGVVRSGSNIYDIPGASLTLPTSDIVYVGVNMNTRLLDYYVDGNVPVDGFIPFYIVQTNNIRIVSVEDARTWAYQDPQALINQRADLITWEGI